MGHNNSSCYINRACESIVHNLSRREGPTKYSKVSNYCIKQTHNDQVRRAQTFIQQHGNHVDRFSKLAELCQDSQHVADESLTKWLPISSTTIWKGHATFDYSFHPKILSLGEPNIQTYSPHNFKSSFIMCIIISCRWKLHQHEHLKYLLTIVLTEK